MRIASNEYETLKAFFIWASNHLIRVSPSLSPDQHPAAVLTGFEAKSPAIARKSLAIGIGDLIEMLADLSREQVAAIDALLEAESIITLSAVRARFWSRIRRILDKGAIRRETDYYALRNVVEDLPEEEQSRAWHILASFEARAVSKAR